MTRINLVPPSELTNRHLIAEYREIFMVPAALKRTLRSKRGYDSKRIPKNFTLNTNHVTFFYDKLGYLYKRYNLLIEEMKNRGMNPDPSRLFPMDCPKENYGDWIPSEDDMNIVRERIALRISQKPWLY